MLRIVENSCGANPTVNQTTFSSWPTHGVTKFNNFISGERDTNFNRHEEFEYLTGYRLQAIQRQSHKTLLTACSSVDIGPGTVTMFE